MEGAAASQRRRRVILHRAAVEHSENAGDDLALLRGESPAQGVLRWVGQLPPEPIEDLMRRREQHAATKQVFMPT